MSWAEVKDYLANHSSWWHELLIFAVIGFMVGFFFRVFGRPLVYVVVGGLLVLVVMNSVGAITIHYHVLFKTVGLSSSTTTTTLLETGRTWFVSHLVGMGSAMVTFFIGWKMGA